MSDRNQLVLNPITGRYVRKYGSSYLRLVAQGTIIGEPVITAPLGQSITEPVQKRNDRGLSWVVSQRTKKILSRVLVAAKSMILCQKPSMNAS